MYLIAPATIIFGGAEMHIDPALLSRDFGALAQRYSIVRFWPSTSFAERRHEKSGRFWKSRVEEPNHRHRRLLRPRRCSPRFGGLALDHHPSKPSSLAC